MLIRLLYRLALQRLGWSAPPVRHPSIAGDRRMLLALAGMVLLVAVGVALRMGVHLPVTRAGAAHGSELLLAITVRGPGPVVAYLRGGVRTSAETATGDVAPPRIVSVGATFEPRFQVARPLSVLQVVNEDPFLHNTHVFYRGGTVFNVATPTRGVVVEKPLVETGVLDVRCDLHSWMQAWIFVPPTSHYAVLDHSATVRFTDVAPGRYVLHLWQPGVPEHLQPVDLGPGEVRSLRLR